MVYTSLHSHKHIICFFSIFLIYYLQLNIIHINIHFEVFFSKLSAFQHNIIVFLVVLVVFLILTFLLTITLITHRVSLLENPF